MADVGKEIKEGRHVGLDFYDLLIEALKTPRSAKWRNPPYHSSTHPTKKDVKKKTSPRRGRAAHRANCPISSPLLATPPRANHANASFLLGGTGCRAGSLSVLMVSLPLLVAALHFVPLLLLLGVQKRADLVVRRFSEIHHLGSAIVLRGI